MAAVCNCKVPSNPVAKEYSATASVQSPPVSPTKSVIPVLLSLIATKLTANLLAPEVVTPASYTILPLIFVVDPPSVYEVPNTDLNKYIRAATTIEAS